MQKRIWGSVGFDESNHGFDKINYAFLPEICVAVAAQSEKETVKTNKLLPKYRQANKLEETILTNKEYSFLLFTESDRTIIPDRQKLGIVLGSLVQGQPVRHSLVCYVDGVWNIEDKNFAKGVISGITRLHKNCIEIIDGKALDTKIRVVNYADMRAYWLLTRKTLDQLKKDPRHKRLLLEYIQ